MAIQSTLFSWSPLLGAKIGKPAEKVSAEQWVEIRPYGYFSKNYLAYQAGKLRGINIFKLEDGTEVINLEDGSIILQLPSGQVIELDSKRRVILVRVRREEAEEARLTLNRHDLSECFKVTSDKEGQSVMVLPGGICVCDDGEKLNIKLANGTEFFTRKCTRAGI